MEELNGKVAVVTGGASDVAADAVVHGIRANRFIVTTHPADISGAAGRRLALADGEDLQSGPLAPDAV